MRDEKAYGSMWSKCIRILWPRRNALPGLLSFDAVSCGGAWSILQSWWKKPQSWSVNSLMANCISSTGAVAVAGKAQHVIGVAPASLAHKKVAKHPAFLVPGDPCTQHLPNHHVPEYLRDPPGSRPVHSGHPSRGANCVRGPLLRPCPNLPPAPRRKRR